MEVQEPDILDVVRAQKGESEAAADAETGERDSLFREAAEASVQNQGGATSLLQRRLRIGMAGPRESSTSCIMPVSWALS